MVKEKFDPEKNVRNAVIAVVGVLIISSIVISLPEGISKTIVDLFGLIIPVIIVIQLISGFNSR